MLPRTVIPLYWLAWILLVPARMFRQRRTTGQAQLAIESGRIGWTHVFFEELLASASEYLDGAEVERVVIDREAPYLPQFRSFLAQTSCTHLLIDIRTGPQGCWSGVWASWVVTWHLTRRRITPIVVLADASLRRHRLQAAILTSVAGLVVTFMAVARVRPMFPHPRILGPLPMPVSVERLRRLEAARSSRPDGTGSVAFIGSVYPPRAQFLAMLAGLLAERGIELRVNADKYGTSNEDYWRVLATSDVIVTTTLQGMPRPPMDWIWIQQMVFRFSEALSAGAVLVAPAVDGVDEWYEPGSDFLPFTSVVDAAEVIASIVYDVHARERVRSSGRAAASRHSEQHAFWAAIDGRLGQAALRPVSS